MSDSYEPNNDGSLEGFLSSRPEVVTQGYVNEGTDNPIVSHDLLTGPVAPSDQGFAAPVGVAPQRQVASPPPPPAQPGVSQEEYEEAVRLAEQQAQVNQALVRQQMELDEALFESSIAHLDQYSQNYYRQQRYLQQYGTANEALAEENRQLKYAQEEREQAEAKSQVALIRMLKAGVNIGDAQAKADIMSADTSEQMNARIQLWAQVHNMSQRQIAAQQTRAQVSSGAYAAAPQRGGNRGATPKRSLEDYISGQPFVYSE